MQARIAHSVVACLWLSLLGIGCRGADEAQSESSRSQERCTRGTVYSCVRWNCNGHRQCSDDGTLSACTCDSPASDGSAGSGGSGARNMAGSASAKGARGATTNTDAGDEPSPRAQSDARNTRAMDAGSDKADARAQDAGDTRTSDEVDAGKPQDSKGGQATMMPTKREQCDNGVDDDSDGKVDCADSDCGALRCVDAAPSGWQGPVALRIAAGTAQSATAADSCKGSFDRLAFEAGAEAQGAAAQCSACTCQGSCSSFVDFQVSAGAQCGSASTCTTSVNGSCVEITPQCLQMATVASLETRLPDAASCTASEQHTTLASPSWKTQVIGCGVQEGRAAAGCSAAQLCLPEEPGDDFAAAYCIWREGESDCPATTYSKRSVYYRELQDTRSCSACACAASGCKYSWRVFGVDDAMCASPVLELSSPGQCAQVNPVMGKLRVGGAVSGTAACAASGGESRGSVTAAKPLTVCCSH